MALVRMDLHHHGVLFENSCLQKSLHVAGRDTQRLTFRVTACEHTIKCVETGVRRDTECVDKGLLLSP